MRNLPQSWLETTLGAVIDYGKTKKVEPAYIFGDEWILELEDIEKETSKIVSRFTFDERRSKSTKNRFTKGDVLYGKLRPYLNKVVIADADGYCTTEIIPIAPTAATDNRYVFHWLRHPKFLEYVTEVSHGLNMPRLGTEAGKGAPFILAPLPEQKRIADKLDTLLARVDSTRTRLDGIPVILKRFRQSVLAAATSGALTEELREGVDIEAAGWESLRAADVCEKVQSGGTPKEGFSKAGIPFLKVYNIVDQKVSFDSRPQFIAPSVHTGSMSKSITRPGDVLMNIVGPPLGKVAVVPEMHSEWNINQAIALFRPSPRISTGWLYAVLCGGENIADIIHETRGSAGQINISLSQCRDFKFPIPPKFEQDEIVRRVESLFAIADRLEHQYEIAMEKVDRLTPAMLAKAFRGELVPQDPSDEPADKLLQRMRSGKAEATQPAVNRGRKTKVA